MMRALLIVVGLLAALWSHPAEAQNVNLNCYTGPTAPQWVPCSSTTPLSSSSIITDGTASGGAAVEPAGEAAASTDPSLVIQLAPQSPGIIAPAVPGTPNTTQVLSVQGESGMTPVLATLSGSSTDPCASSGVAKSSVPINVTSATTTSLVATSGTTTVYVCGFAITIAPSATSADTALFERGTGAACVTTQAALTGTFGNGDLTSAAPVVSVVYGGGSQTVFKSAGTDAICIVTTGTAVNVQGVMTYVQQ
jgi:hypothetical protein